MSNNVFITARFDFKQKHNGVVFSRVRAQVLLQLRVPQQRGHVVQRKVVVPATVHAKGVRC